MVHVIHVLFNVAVVQVFLWLVFDPEDSGAWRTEGSEDEWRLFRDPPLISKWGPIFWKIQAIKLKDNPPQKRAQLGSRYIYIYLGGGNSKIFFFTPKIGEIIPILTNSFQMGWNHQLVLLVETKGSKPAKGLRNTNFSIWNWRPVVKL